MPEPTISGFVPKWFLEQPFDAVDAVPVAFGTVPDQDPRVVTRLVPKDHGYTLPAQTVSRVIDLKQALAFHAARDVSQGFNPNFADLTSLTKTLREAATLALEPAEPGSYIIPARLPVRSGTIAAEAVIARYAELLGAIDEPQKATEVSIGALQVCRELANLLRRDVESIEITTYDRENMPRPTCRLTSASVDRIDRLLAGRRVTDRKFEKLTGRLEALDLGKNEFQLKLESHRKRVRGTAAFFSLTSLRERLGEVVTLEGHVVWDQKSTTMTAYRVVEADDDQGDVIG